MLRKLSGKVVSGAKPLDRPYEIRDAARKGLLLRVQPSGVKSYIVEFGRGIRRTIGSAAVLTLEQARITARQWVAEHDSGKLPPAARGKHKPMTLGEFIEDKYAPWVTSERKAGAATLAALKAQFERDFYSKSLSAITVELVDKFKADRLRAGIRPATVNRDLVRIRAVLSKAVEWGSLDKHPLAGVKRAKSDDEARVRYLTADEENALRDALAKREAKRKEQRASGNVWSLERKRPVRPQWTEEEFTDHVAPLVLIAINTGLRRGELFGLTWTDVDLPQRVLTLRAATTKAQRPRRVPLNSEAHSVLTQWRKQCDGEGLVFPGDDGARMTNINKAWAALTKGAKLDNFRFHDLRHSFASRLVMAGADLYVVKELLGHQDFGMTQRYAHLAPEHKAAAVALLVRGAS